MNKEILSMMLRIFVALPFIVFLIYAVLKYGGTNLQKIQNGKFLKILERVQISKDNSLMVVKMGEKSYVVASTPQRVEILKELTVDEEIISKDTPKIPEFKNFRDMLLNIKRKGR